MVEGAPGGLQKDWNIRARLPKTPILAFSGTLTGYVSTFCHTSLSLHRPSLFLDMGCDRDNTVLLTAPILRGHARASKALEFLIPREARRWLLNDNYDTLSISKTLVFVNNITEVARITQQLINLPARNPLLFVWHFAFPQLISVSPSTSTSSASLYQSVSCNFTPTEYREPKMSRYHHSIFVTTIFRNEEEIYA